MFGVLVTILDRLVGQSLRALMCIFLDESIITYLFIITTTNTSESAIQSDELKSFYFRRNVAAMMVPSQLCIIQNPGNKDKDEDAAADDASFVLPSDIPEACLDSIAAGDGSFESSSDASRPGFHLVDESGFGIWQSGNRFLVGQQHSGGRFQL